MIPREIIEKAIEGGWDGEWDMSLGAVKHLGTENGVGWEIVALDSKFWQALGREFAWGGRNYYDYLKACKEHAHRFYDIVLENYDPHAFWKDLLATKTV